MKVDMKGDGGYPLITNKAQLNNVLNQNTNLEVCMATLKINGEELTVSTVPAVNVTTEAPERRNSGVTDFIRDVLNGLGDKTAVEVVVLDKLVTSKFSTKDKPFNQARQRITNFVNGSNGAYIFEYNKDTGRRTVRKAPQPESND